MSLVHELAALDLFAGFTPEQLESLACRVRTERVGRGEVVVRYGDAQNTCFYMIRQGRVEVAGRAPGSGEAAFAVLGAGNHFGELSLLDGEPRSASVVALENCELLVLDRAGFLQFLRETPSAALVMLAALSRLIRRLNRRLENRNLPMERKVVRHLLDLATAGQPTLDGSILVGTGLSQTQMARLWDLSRARLCEQFAVLQDRGLIRLQGKGKIEILDVGALRAMVEDEA